MRTYKEIKSEIDNLSLQLQKFDMSDINELIENSKKHFQDNPSCKCYVFPNIDVLNKNRKSILELTCYIISYFEVASNGYVNVKVDRYDTHHFELMKNNFIDKNHSFTILEFLQNTYPDIVFSQSHFKNDLSIYIKAINER